ncbi:AIPR family protein [Kitasatospora sp. GP82]|uniref:AIPR family protein n=1 Tax=Kitasatospora sp. GP82 TaxID=3035089 RepID=UPI0024754BB9|nr:AIPR family protein [Kitasatospora sp. GP82]MDH6123635.1 hypothetical protein [Kitasatospora sp. GP82]
MAAVDQSSFAKDLVNEVMATGEAERSNLPEVFTRSVLEDLEEAGVVSNYFTAYHAVPSRLMIHGYGLDDAAQCLDLFVTEFQTAPLEGKLTKTRTATLFRQLLAFLSQCSKVAEQFDDFVDVREMSLAVERALPGLAKIRLFLLTNCISSSPTPVATEFNGIEVTHEIWDLPRLHRRATSGALGEPIIVEFEEPLPCLAAESTEPDYSVVMAVAPGQRLAELYGEHGPGLLELNVRSFLQTRGAVNRGIRTTLLKAPGRFLAYNNGITATASRVDFVQDSAGRPIAIRRIHGLQIVNGGQTTASLHYALKRDRADLSNVFVQMKLSVVAPERLAEIVPKISEYSNTQNRVTLVDFSSNHAYHVAVQRITRVLWAEAYDASGQATHWFYERARGQYADELASRTPAQQTKFKVLCPSKQKFTKSDLAKYVHSWEQLPHLVSRGAQKNFAEFMIRMQEHEPVVDAIYCQRLIAKAILFKAVDRIAFTLGAGSHKSIVTTYTIARLSRAVELCLDLDKIWQMQQISPVLQAALYDLCQRVMTTATNPTKGNHVGEWAKSVGCWNAVSEVQWTVPDALKAELLSEPLADRIEAADGSTDPRIEEVLAVTAEEWTAIERWAKETRTLEPPERQAAAIVGRRLAAGESVSRAQAEQALQARSEALRQGFNPAYDV